MSLQLWHRTPKKSRSWSKFTNLKKGATLEMVAYEGDEWVALDKRTQKTLEINGDTKYYQPKPNTQESRATCIITRKGNGKGNYFEYCLVLQAMLILSHST